ncbi:MAG: prolipoprotein diacylglyceryl transferase, partial [Candidatus Acidiferrales bacterium]
LLALTLCGVYAWWNGTNFAALGDVYSPGVAAGYALGRLGCFAAGCCWGKPLEAAWAVTFTDPYSARVVGVPLGVALHPTQIYSSIASALIFLLLVLLWRRRAFAGQIFAAYMMLYAVARFVIEFYRGDPRGDYFFNGALSQAQTICIALFVVALLFGLYQRRRGAVPAHAESS